MIGSEARKLIENRYADQRIVKDLVDLYERLRKA